MTTVIETVTPIPPCQECHCPREIGVMPDSSAVIIATCRTPFCRLETVTLPPDQLLTEEEVVRYALVNRRFRESRAKFAAREAGRLMGAESC